MKKKLMGMLIGVLMVFVAVPAWSLSILDGATFVDVGNLDVLVAQATSAQVGSSDAEELAWIQNWIPDATAILKNETLGAWESVYDSGVLQPNYAAHPLFGTPEYYLVKTGNNNINDYRVFLFDNSDALAWAVINMPVIYIAEVGKISHITEPTPGTQVPEPGTLLLLGTGLLGLGIIRRRRA